MLFARWFMIALLIMSLSASSIQSALAVASSGGRAANGPIGDKWAVVIGLSKFADPRVPQLKYSSKDAHDFYNYLVDPSGGNFRADHVRLLTDDEATKVNIMDTLGDSFLPHAAAPEDLVVIYISTHGSPAGADVAGVSYLIAYDTQVDKLFSTGVEMAQLQRIVKRAHTNRILLVLDTCYSGAGNDGHKGIVRHNVNAGGIAQGLGCLVISSSDLDQRSWESDELKNSYFTRYFIDTLKEQGAKTPLTKVFDTIKDRVRSAVLKDKGEIQTPVIGGEFKGPDLVLGLPATVVRQAPPSVPLTATAPSAASGKGFGSSIAEYVFHMRNAHAFIDQRKWFEANHELDAATKLSPTSVEAFLVYSDVLDAQGRYMEALEAAKRAVTNDDASSEAHEKLSRAYLQMRDANEALRQVQKSLTLDPENSMAETLLGYINEHQFSRTDLAEQQYRQALGLNPLNLRAMIDLGRLLQKEGRDSQETERLFRKAVEADSDDPDARLALGQFLIQQNQYAQAESEIRKGAELDPTNVTMHCEMGNVLSHDRANYDAAEAQYRKAVELAPKDGYAHFVLGRFLVECRQQYEEGERELRSALQLDPTLDKNCVTLADLVISRRKAYDEADALYKKALVLNPRNTRAHLGLARIASDLFHNYSQAQDELQKALAINPKYAEAYLQLGLLYDKQGRQDEAEQQYKKAVNADATNAWAHYYLGMLYLQRPKTKTADDAINELKQAVAIDPNVSVFHTKLGWLLTDRYKRHKDAESEFRAAIASNIADSEAHYRLGMLLIERLSQRKAGEHELQTAFTQNSNDKDIQAAFNRFVPH